MEIHLKNFGRFKDRRFRLAPLTIFFGSNEAGKSTLHDAFFEALCQPRGNLKAGKRLKERYGEERLVELESKTLPTTMDTHEFRVLRSIRSEDLFFQPSDSNERSWFDGLRSRLFFGGLEPEAIIEKIDRAHNSERPNTRTYKRKKEFTQKLHDAEERERELKREHELLLKEELALRNNAGQLDRLAVAGAQLQTKRSELNERIKQAERSSERLRLERSLELNQERTRLEEQGRELDRYSETGLKKIDELSAALQESATARLKIQTENDALSERLTEEEQRHAERSSELSRRAELSREADHYLDRIRNAKQNLPHLTHYQSNKKLFPVWAGLVLAAAALPFLPHQLFDSYGFYLSGGVLLLTAALFFLLGRTKSQVVDDSALDGALRELQEDWRRKTGETGRENSSDSFEKELILLQSQALSEKEQLSESEAALEKLKKRATDSAQELEKLLRTNSEKEELLSKELKAAEVRSRDDYRDRLQESENNRSALERVAGELKRQSGDRELAAYLTECERKLRAFDEEGVDSSGVDEAELTRLRRELESLQQKIHENEESSRDLLARKTDFAARFDERQRFLMEKLRDAATDVHEHRQALDEIETNHRAAELASGILSGLEDSSGAELKLLVDDVAKRLNHVFGDERPLRIESLNDHEILVTDSTGELRPLEHLSKGTRDSFIFAARLSLLKRTSEESSLLLLDDPFLTLDDKRVQAAVELLLEYQRESGDTVLFFTKESEVCERLKSAFDGDALVHEL